MTSYGYLDEIFDSHADDIRDIVTSAFVRSYEQNATCFDESIGHTPLVYGFMVRSTGIMHLAQAFEDIPSVRVTESGNLFNVGFRGGWTMHFYKYRDMQSAKFDRSGVRRDLVSANQLSLFADSVGTRPVGEVAGLGRHLVVVHQGDPHHGLRSIDVGVPVSMAVDGSQWLWRENIYAAPIAATPLVGDAPPMVPTYADMPMPELTLGLAEKKVAADAETQGRAS
jgi:hypothetical protein